MCVLLCCRQCTIDQFAAAGGDLSDYVGELPLILPGLSRDFFMCVLPCCRQCTKDKFAAVDGETFGHVGELAFGRDFLPNPGSPDDELVRKCASLHRNQQQT
jgi:hypothetical protein